MQLYSQKSGWRWLRSTVPCEKGRTSSQTCSFQGRYQRRNLSSAVISNVAAIEPRPSPDGCRGCASQLRDCQNAHVLLGDGTFQSIVHELADRTKERLS